MQYSTEKRGCQRFFLFLDPLTLGTLCGSAPKALPWRRRRQVATVETTGATAVNALTALFILGIMRTLIWSACFVPPSHKVDKQLAILSVHAVWATPHPLEEGNVTVEEVTQTSGAETSSVVASAGDAAPATSKPEGSKKKQVRQIPRQKIVKVLSVGMEVTGKVKRTSEFGAFVDIGVGRDGLLHISEMDTKRVAKVTDKVKEGDVITVWIKQLDREKNRISLTMIPPGTKTIRDLNEGDLVTGVVQRLTNYGAFVDIGLERQAMLHVKEMADTYVAKPEDVVKVGDEIEARIIGIDRRRGRIDLSLKGLRPPAEPAEPEEPVVELTPLTVANASDETSDDDDDLPTLMELAFRQAFESSSSGRRRSKKENRRQRHRDQDEILERTLRYHSR